MKKIVSFSLLVGIVLAFAYVVPESRVHDKNQYLYSVTVTTHTAVTGGTWMPGRVYYKAKNISSSYRVKRASWNFNYSDYGEVIDPNGGWWEDKYNVYQSSWWYIIVEDGPANTTAYTATLEIQERD